MGPCWICQFNISLLIMTATSIFGANYWYYVLLGSITLSLSRASPTVEIPSSKEKGKNSGEFHLLQKYGLVGPLISTL